MKNPKYIASDTETGGLLFLEHPLLTAYFVILDEDFEKIDELSLAVLPYGDRTTLTEGAMKVNGINIEEHNKIAISHIEASKQLENFLKKWKIGNNKLTAIGQNFEFDRNFIFYNLLDQEVWNKYCGRGYLDSKRIMDFFVDLEIYPADATSLEKAVVYLEIPKLTHHDAKADTTMTIAVYKKLKNMFKNAINNSGNFDQGLLEAIE